MLEYVFQEYPKCLYRSVEDIVTVTNQEEEILFAADGYLTAAQFHKYPSELEKKKKKKDELT